MTGEGRPTRIRYTIVLLTLLINVICYTDRVAIAVAGPRIREQFGFDAKQMGLVFSIFSLSYALGQAPWGALADRFGARGLVTGAILAWSAFTALTGAAWGLASLLFIRFVFGALEAALSPSVAVAFTRWVPVAERSTAFGAYLSGGRLGAALTPPAAAFLMLQYGWQWMFSIFGALGVAAAIVWFSWYRHDPSQHPQVNAAERELIRTGTSGAVPREPEKAHWGYILRSTRLWCLLGVAFATTFLWQFFITWFPTYLMEQRGMALQEASYFAGLPFLFGVAATWVGGLVTDYLTRRFDARRGRIYLGSLSLGVTAVLMLLGILAPAARVAALLMAAAVFFVDLYLGAAWASAVDIGGRSGGAVAGLMNAASNAAGFASPALMGWVLYTWHDWNTVLLAGVATTFAGAVLWLGVNPRPRPV